MLSKSIVSSWLQSLEPLWIGKLGIWKTTSRIPMQTEVHRGEIARQRLSQTARMDKQMGSFIITYNIYNYANRNSDFSNATHEKSEKKPKFKKKVTRKLQQIRNLCRAFTTTNTLLMLFGILVLFEKFLELQVPL